MHYVLTFGKHRVPKYFENKTDLLGWLADVECLLSDYMRSRIKVWRCPYGFTQFRNIYGNYINEDLPKEFLISNLKNFTL